MILNNFFAGQCQPLKNVSDLPTNQIFLTQSRLGSLDFNEGELLQIIRALNINKVQGHGDISIRIIKLCDRSLLKPLIYCSGDRLNHPVSLIFGKNLISCLFINKMTNNWLKTTYQFLFTYLW